ncbi:MAG TPA: hypothetical protein VFA65_23705 [Bryobacteraceae bacterium]|nr:hypothetical protein [Bryobacteraceae bacterium]
MEPNSPQAQAGAQPPAATLPVEHGSESELLFSTHVFAISPMTVDSTEWTRGKDGLEHREIRVQAKLGEIFKGKLAIKAGDVFSFTVYQHREDEFFSNDYHGLWSYVQLQPGVEYLIVSSGNTNRVAELLKEGACHAVLDASYVADARAAIEAEWIYRTALAKADEPDADVAAASALLGFANGQRSKTKDLFGRYLWARVLPVFLHSYEKLEAPVLSLVLAEDATRELRGAVISGVYEGTLLLEPNPELTRAVIRAFFSLLRQKSAAPLAYKLVEVQLYNLVLREGNVDVPVESIYPEQPDRDALRKALEPFQSERARQLSNWLAQPVAPHAR